MFDRLQSSYADVRHEMNTMRDGRLQEEDRARVLGVELQDGAQIGDDRVLGGVHRASPLVRGEAASSGEEYALVA